MKNVGLNSFQFLCDFYLRIELVKELFVIKAEDKANKL